MTTVGELRSGEVRKRERERERERLAYLAAQSQLGG